jgi:hypothetical protein
MLLLFALVVSAPQLGYSRTARNGKLLYMTLAKGYRHRSVAISQQIVKEMGEKSGAFDATLTEDVGAFTKENLKSYDAVMFYTTGELPMTDEEKNAFADFIRSGHGFVGVHSATDTFYTWGTYGELTGGWFNNHPWHEMVTIDVVDPKSSLVSFLGDSFQINDEIYQISDFKAETSHLLLQLDPKSVNTQKEDARIRYYGWPVAWTRMFGKGRVYYNSLGHEEAVWKDPRYQEMLLNGIRWVMRQID